MPSPMRTSSPVSANKRALARVLSVVGHPALTMPVVALGQAWCLGAPGAVMVRLALVLVILLGALAVYVVRQVRAGRWLHPDASLPVERSRLNRFLLVLMPLGALLSLVVLHEAHLATALGLGSAMVGAAVLLRQRLKLSLHVAFAVFAALVWLPAVVVTLGWALLAAGVAWSRCVLGRHTWPDVWAGVLVGVVAGGVYASAIGLGGAACVQP
jgi:hypothetical protein